MPRVHITNGQLKQLKDDINKQIKSSNAFGFFHKTRIDAFFRQNKFILDLLEKRTDELVKTYAMHDSEGKPVITHKDGNDHYTFVDQATEDKYVHELTAFLEITNAIEG